MIGISGFNIPMFILWIRFYYGHKQKMFKTITLFLFCYMCLIISIYAFSRPTIIKKVPMCTTRTYQISSSFPFPYFLSSILLWSFSFITSRITIIRVISPTSIVVILHFLFASSLFLAIISLETSFSLQRMVSLSLLILFKLSLSMCFKIFQQLLFLASSIATTM